MTLSLFFEDSKKTLKETDSGFELTSGAETEEFDEVSFFQDLRDWELDRRFGKFPFDEEGFAEHVEFDGGFLSKLDEKKGRDENGFKFNWVTYGNFVLFQFGIDNGKSSVQILKKT